MLASSSSTGLSNPFESTDDDLIAQDLVPAIGRLTIQQFLKGELKKEGEGPESWEAEVGLFLVNPNLKVFHQVLMFPMGIHRIAIFCSDPLARTLQLIESLFKELYTRSPPREKFP